ncbi:acyltransferase family protein [Brachybacterium sp. J144]|uniref:acyltransferase family protein n=1 Tax=Brachybacterium sp. J144 TaxID=3116487 RepID=UPI002E784F27|nr:acyltransferase family protein [Brachybacterium sp. J144]MEE1650841.1 acyltransferase family protein [Brachybacterium sp. J144]
MSSPAPSSSTAEAAGVGAHPASHAGRFRPELHGLRGVAIGLVVLYHVWFDRVSGGVDVFLFLSSFLLVGTFMRRVGAGRPTAPLAYWARTFKRLLPPTTVVALATLAGVYLLLPAERWMTAITDAIGSVLHVQNWVLIRRGVDYYAAEEVGASPFQHFWSLSIQGQVFLLWPLLIGAAVLVARWRRWSVRPVLAVVFTLVLVASFAWSVVSTATHQEIAYFDTAARLWEFAAGSLLGLALPALEERRERSRGRRARPRVSPVRVAAGWAGILGLLSCGLLVDVQGAFPGWIAAWPLTAAALVLWAGATGSRLGVDRLLSSRPAARLGDVSYGLYLVHWPLLTLYLAHAGKARAGLLDGLVLILVSLVLAWLLTRLVDTPIRRWPWAGARAWRGGLVVASCLVLALAPMLGAREHLLGEQREAEARAVADNPGARVLDPGFTVHPDANPDAAPLPSTATVPGDWVVSGTLCSGDLEPRPDVEPKRTSCGIVEGDPEGKVVISVGNSRIEQFTGALIPLAQENGWTLITLWKGGCVYAPDAEVSPDCDAWSAQAREYIERVSPDAVLVHSTFLSPELEETVTPGMETTLPDLTAAGIEVIALRDQPRLAVEPVPCTEEKGAEDPSCASPLPEPLSRERPDAALLAEQPDGVVPLDVNDLICPDGVCSPVIGNVRVSLDRDHLTGTYAASMQDAVAARLEETGFRW